MTPVIAGVTGRSDNHYALPDCLFGRLVDNASGTGNIFISAERNIQDPNVIALLIINNPSNPTSNIFFRDPALFACLYQNQICVRGETSIDLITQVSTACCGY